MEQHKNCKKYPCDWCFSVKGCPTECQHFKHRDEVIVTRCKDCEWYRENGSICKNPKCGKSWYGCRVPEMHYCSFGERKDNG